MNRLITKREVEDILNAIVNIGDDGNRLEIRNLDIYQTAFVHKTYTAQIDPTLNYAPKVNNEVLEFLGDSFIGAVVADYLVERFDDQQEGFLTKTRTKMVRSEMLHRFARFLMMGKFILLSPQVEKLTAIGPNKGRNNARLYEDCFEAFVGAIIRDFREPDNPIAGAKYVYRFLVSIIEHIIDFADIIMYNENFKDTLQRYFQHLKWPNPVYIDLSESGPSHMRVFTKGVFLRKEYLQTLSPEVQKQTIEYHNEQLQSIHPKIAKAIVEHAAETDSYLIGLGTGNKKNAAEQTCSSIGLCCLNVHHNWEGPARNVGNGRDAMS
jgi:ribonuclease III